MENAEMNASLFERLKEEITTVKKENSSLKLEVQSIKQEGQREIMELLKDIVSILDIFEKAKMVVTEKGWDSTEEGKKVLGRFLNVEKQLLNKLSIHGVKEIPIEVGALVDDFLCIVCDTEPDMEKENDTIIGIEKKGYTYKDSVLRPTDVIIVKN
jgi:molecular chaperone GrpE (heat shock protein)